jgi:hypothetical protein
MNDPTGAIAQVAATKSGWLLLITEVPPKPDYLRVKLRRRIQRLGAVGLKGALYLLPDTADARESFQWLRQEIVGDGGDATLCATQLLDGMSDTDAIGLFNRDRDEEYSAFIKGCAALEQKWSEATSDAERASLTGERGRVFASLEEILGRDYFSSNNREAAMQAVERLAVLDIVRPNTSEVSRDNLRNRLWVTRTGIKVDRISSAWLIQREIDPSARFAFVDESAVIPDGAVKFDMFDGEFTHQGNRCTFEILLDRFNITDPALRIIGQIVHDLDLHDDAHARPETAGFASMINGIVATLPGDEERLREGASLLDRFVAGLRQ